MVGITNVIVVIAVVIGIDSFIKVINLAFVIVIVIAIVIVIGIYG